MMILLRRLQPTMIPQSLLLALLQPLQNDGPTLPTLKHPHLSLQLIKPHSAGYLPHLILRRLSIQRYAQSCNLLLLTHTRSTFLGPL